MSQQAQKIPFLEHRWKVLGAIAAIPILSIGRRRIAKLKDTLPDKNFLGSEFGCGTIEYVSGEMSSKGFLCPLAPPPLVGK